MFDEARRDTSDQLSMTMGELEEWLDDNEYPVTSVTLAGELPLAQPGGLALSGDNDAITIGFLAAEGAERSRRQRARPVDDDPSIKPVNGPTNSHSATGDRP